MSPKHDRQIAVLTDLDGIFFELVDHDGMFGVSARIPEEIRLIPGLGPALDRLKEQGGYRILGITNQPDISRGIVTPEFLARKHALLLDMYPQIEKIFCCEHVDEDGCACRKPKPGLILQAAEEFQLDLARCWFVGDTWRDVEAGAAAQVRTVMVRTPHNASEPSLHLAAAFVNSPADAFDLIGARHELELARSR